MVPLPSNLSWNTLFKATGEKAESGISTLFQPLAVGTAKVYGISTGPGLIKKIFMLVELAE